MLKGDDQYGVLDLIKTAWIQTARHLPATILF
jgi:hypothetical protein